MLLNQRLGFYKSVNKIQYKKMNLLLLQKIEELTLYTLQQQKQLDALQGQVQLLTKQE